MKTVYYNDPMMQIVGMGDEGCERVRFYLWDNETLDYCWGEVGRRLVEVVSWLGEGEDVPVDILIMERREKDADADARDAVLQVWSEGDELKAMGVELDDVEVEELPCVCMVDIGLVARDAGEILERVVEFVRRHDAAETEDGEYMRVMEDGVKAEDGVASLMVLPGMNEEERRGYAAELSMFLGVTGL